MSYDIKLESNIRAPVLLELFNSHFLTFYHMKSRLAVI